MTRVLAILLLSFAAQGAPVLNAVEFPFAEIPRQLWDRELVWMKNAGIRTVALEVRTAAEEDDAMLILRTIRKLELSAWVRLGAASLNGAMEPMLAIHGGPIAFLNAGAPQPVTRIDVLAANALAASRTALGATHGTILWTNVEDTLRPEFHAGAISFLGEEQPAVSSLRRDAALIGYWQAGIEKLTAIQQVRASAGQLPEGVSARQFLAPGEMGVSAVSIINRSKLPYRGDLRVYYPPAKRAISLVGIEVPAAESLWLPVNVPLAKGPFCKNCSALGNDDAIVYATAELIDAEYENGILAMEFASLTPSEVILHLSKEPSGPLLAAGKPRTFDWDEQSGRARLPVPAGKAPDYRVRIGLALEPPEHSAFFEDAKVLIIGQRNILPTTYTSEAIAGRSRVRGPAGWKFEAIPKGPLEIDYAVTVPETALNGDRMELALEADGVQMGHASARLLRPASLRLRDAVSRHFGMAAELPMYPALVSMDQRAGRSIDITVRNNFPAIKNFVLEMAGEGLEFSPARTEISVGASSERDISVRVFPSDGAKGLREATARLTGAGEFELPMLLAVIPRGETISYSAGGVHVLESAKARAVFADPAYRKWLEFTWKDSDRNVLPDAGVDFGPGGRRIVLTDAELTVEQETPLPPERLKAGKQADVNLAVRREGTGKAVYTLSR
jgi:hypothetical protein